MLVGRLLVQDCVSPRIYWNLEDLAKALYSHTKKTWGWASPAAVLCVPAQLGTSSGRTKGNTKSLVKGPYQLMHLKP